MRKVKHGPSYSEFNGLFTLAAEQGQVRCRPHHNSPLTPPHPHPPDTLSTVHHHAFSHSLLSSSRHPTPC